MDNNNNYLFKQNTKEQNKRLKEAIKQGFMTYIEDIMFMI